MTHDPLCDWWQNQCESDCNINLAYGDPCEHMWCTCALIAKVRSDQDAKYINHSCVWGQAECIPDCPTCLRLDELYLERSVGYKEGYTHAIKSSIQIIENLPCKCDNGMDYCDGQTDAIESIERLVGNI